MWMCAAIIVCVVSRQKRSRQAKSWTRIVKLLKCNRQQLSIVLSPVNFLVEAVKVVASQTSVIGADDSAATGRRLASATAPKSHDHGYEHELAAAR